MTELFSPLRDALTNAQAAIDLGDVAQARRQVVRAQFNAAGLDALNTLDDRFADLDLPGVGPETEFRFKHVVEPHPLQGYMARYPKEDGNIRGLLGYRSNYVLWFASRAPLVQWVVWGDGKLHPGYLFADNGRLCAAELAGAVAAGEIPVIALPFDPDQAKYPNLPDGTFDPRNKGPFSLQELAQGPNGPAALYFTQLAILIRRLVAEGITKAWFRLAWEHTGSWFRDRALAGQGGWWALAFNQIGAFIKALMPDARMIWNMAREVSGGCAPIQETLWISPRDADTINAAGLGITAVAGTPIDADAVGPDPYNACWLAGSKVANGMTDVQVQAAQAYRWKNEGGRYFDTLETVAETLGVPLCLPEWGTGYDSAGVPVDAAGQPLWLQGKVGGDDAYYVERIYERVLKWRRAGKLLFACYWERKASDGNTALSFAANVSHRTGKVSGWTSAKPDPSQKLRAAKKFVECFGVPYCG